MRPVPPLALITALAGAAPAAAVPSARRSGWPGGIAVDRPRCATVRVRAADGRTFRRRVPLGRRCR